MNCGSLSRPISLGLFITMALGLIGLMIAINLARGWRPKSEGDWVLACTGILFILKIIVWAVGDTLRCPKCGAVRD